MMPVIPKSKTIQLRIEPDLFDKFSAECDAGNVSVSFAIRRLMVAYLDHAEQRRRKASKDAEWAATLESRRQGASASSSVEKPLVGPSGKSEGPVARRMRLKKEAKARRSGQDLPDDEIEDGDEE
jgi:hypothetical protein